MEGSTSSGCAGRALYARTHPNPGAAPQSRPSRCCQLTRGVAANGRPPRPVSCIATAPPALPGGPSRRPAVPPACTRVPKVTTPRRRPELVKHPITVRSGRSPQVHRTHRVPAAARPQRSHPKVLWAPPTATAMAPTGHPLPSSPGRRGRAAECTCLENRSPSRDRGFKSLRLRSVWPGKTAVWVRVATHRRFLGGLIRGLIRAHQTGLSARPAPPLAGWLELADT